MTDPTSGNISSSSTFDLNINGKDYALTPASTNLDSLVASINSSGANVQAPVVNVGGTSAPDYRLSIRRIQYAPDTIPLNAGSTFNSTGNLLSQIGDVPRQDEISGLRSGRLRESNGDV